MTSWAFTSVSWSPGSSSIPSYRFRFGLPPRALHLGALTAAALLLLASGCAGRALPRPADHADLVRVIQQAHAALGRGDPQSAREALIAFIESDPNSLSAAIAHDILTELAGQRLLEETRWSCPEPATAALAQAEGFLLVKKHEAVIREYERALRLCPENAKYWVLYGNAFFAVEDYSRAAQAYDEALDRDPWNRMGHRFRADTWTRLGNLRAAYDEAVLAVVSDPTYEAGWHFLHSITSELGGGFRRVRITKPKADNGEDGEPYVSLPPPTSEKDGMLWLMYWSVQSHPEEAVSPESSAEVSEAAYDPLQELSPLGLELACVKVTLEFMDMLGAKGRTGFSPFWDLMDSARQSAYLTEAVLMHLLDRNLVDDYVQYREEHGDRLVAYVKGLVAPVP